eukprot:jgi/Picre1/30448/NNA_005812.t1
MSVEQTETHVADAPALVRPCLQKITTELSGRKYSKVQEDIESLLERLDGLMVIGDIIIKNVTRVEVKRGSVGHGGEEREDQEEEEEDGGKISDSGSSIFDKCSEEIVDDSYSGHEMSSGSLADGAAREIMLVLHDAIATKKPAVIDASLDCLQKLVSFSLLQGSVFIINHKRDAMAKAFQDTAGEAAPLQFAAQAPQAQAVELICSCDDTGDDTVDLRLLKAILTVITSSSLRVHSQALLLCVRSAYNVFLTSKSQVIQVTAKATLIQIVNVVFQRLEEGKFDVSLPPIAISDVLQTTAVDPFGTAAATLQAQLDEAFVPRRISSNSVNQIDGGGEMPNSPLMHVLRTTSHEPAASGQDDKEVSKSEPRSAESKYEEELLQILEKDGFLLLRALCNCQSEAQTLLRENHSSSTTLQHLCSSIFTVMLLKFRSQLKAEVGVFYPMILLKSIETPVGGVSHDLSTPTLAMAASDAAHKTVILKCLDQISVDGQVLVDLFVNYDCDIEGGNLFERTISATVRLAQGGHAYTGIDDVVEVREMRFEALHVLTQTVRSLRMWHAQVTSNVQDSKTSVTNGEQERVDDEPTDTTSNVQVGGEVEDSVRSKWMAQLASGQRSLPQQADAKQGDLVKLWKDFKNAFEKGVSLFNDKPKKGVEFLQSQKLLGEAPEDVARFLCVTNALDKSMIGDYLGERDDTNLRVMHAYVDDLDFSGLEFDKAIRSFLSGFRLPGEAQKIDRLMEKFAERYVRCNPDAFKSADVAYVLAYSVIMLNTDAHNPMVKKKMSKEDFLRNNRGINDGGTWTLSDEAKEGLPTQGWFDSIISLIPGRQQGAIIEPTDDIVKRTAERLRRMAQGASFVEANDVGTLRPMVDVLWAPVLGAFSVLFESEQDQRFIDTSIDGFRESVILMSRLEMLMLQNAFLSSLTRFTSLNVPSRIGFKHVKAFRTLLLVAEEIGDSLGDRWFEILRCVSRFEMIASFGAGVPVDVSAFNFDESDVTKGGKHRSVSASVDDLVLEASSSIDAMMLQMSSKPDLAKRSLRESSLPGQDTLKFMQMEDLTRFYLSSVKLSTESVIAFVKALCEVALEELDSAAAPRVFSLTQIVEIAHFNMNRIRIVWGRIWAELSDFFVKVGCHQNLSVGMYLSIRCDNLP